MNKLVRFLLLLLLGFLALTAIPGGIALLAGVFTPPVEMLRGSPFGSFLVPGLALAVLVGGSASVAFVMFFRRRRGAAIAGFAAAVAVIVFEFVEIATIGSPPGPARNMQILYLGIGLTIGLLALASRRFPSES